MKDKLNKYKFEFKHVAILFTVIILFEIIMFFVFKDALSSFIVDTQQWYQEYSSNRIATYSASSFEMLIETVRLDEEITDTERNKMIQKFDILLNQQMVEKDIEEICLFMLQDNEYKLVDNGEVLFSLLVEKNKNIPPANEPHEKAAEIFNNVKEKILNTESMLTKIVDNTFYNFIPFEPDGEFAGVMLIKSRPNFSSVTSQFIYNYDIIAIVFSVLILTGLFLMYLISSNTISTRDKAQEELFDEKNAHMKERLNHEKEFVFTKRIYHAHHKAEKIIGFINSDLSLIKGDREIVNRIEKYSNFIARIIYDMKWYEPQISTIRNPIFRTNINDVVTFMVDNLFLRLSINSEAFKIKTKLDENFPLLFVNEYVIWEIIEPLVQNSVTHNSHKSVEIIIKTEYNEADNVGVISIEDNGKGIAPDFMEEQEGIKKLFHEHTSSKDEKIKSYGYGCFIAYNMAGRCGWKLDVENIEPEGCRFNIIINF